MSTTPSAILKRLGISTHSYVAAAQDAGALRSSTDLRQYNDLIAELTGTDLGFDELSLAQVTFGYLVQDLVHSMLNEPKPISDLLTTAQEKAKLFVAREPWHWQSRATAKVTRIEEVKRFVEMFDGIDRMQLVDRLAEDFEITRATASTYLRSLDKETEEVSDQPKAEKKPRINKGVEASKLVAEHFTGSNKNELIDMIVAKLETSRGGAQTFYYAAIKNLGLTATKSEKAGGGSTQEKLKPIIEANPAITKAEFMAEAEKLGIKRTTAQTYYYSMTNELGVERVGTAARGRKKTGGSSRAEQVIELMTANSTLSKTELIDLLSTTFNVGKLSAQSYYYAAKNKKQHDQQHKETND